MQQVIPPETALAQAATAPAAKPAVASVRIKSQDLFQQRREVEIDHEGRIYRLRLTQLNKLILTA
ncbi:MAG TPA: hemin uptake protein HemP [Burkholderiaceae bacterium]|nr:hemin uptake protein HemP [Burkholderiaceae bacterium]